MESFYVSKPKVSRVFEVFGAVVVYEYKGWEILDSNDGYYYICNNEYNEEGPFESINAAMDFIDNL